MLKKKDEIEEWFINYTESFILESEELQQNIQLKREHSLRVREEAVYLAEKLHLSQNDTALAEIAAILHDAGRFEQFNRFRTFADKNSVNHAELGVQIIKDFGLLDGFDSESESIILKSICYHNRPSLPEKEDQRVLYFSKLLRDADKLDIWKVVLDYYSIRDVSINKSIELDLPDTDGISPEVFEDIMKNSIVNMIHVKNLNDFKILQAGWVFDLNFKPSFERIEERKYISRLKSVLPETDVINLVFHEVYKYLNEVKK